MSDAATIASVIKAATSELQQCSGDDLADSNSRLDAELLLCHCLQKPRTYLYTWPERTLTEAQLDQYNDLIKRCSKGEPVAYITGVREFWSQPFEVTKDTLIPRPDTEILVEQCLNKLENSNGPFLDLGTGSGVIAICVAIERPDIDVSATDISADTLAVAERNAAKLKASVSFSLSHWLEDLPPRLFAVIASNPPYIAAGDPHLEHNGLPFEPLTALQSCDNGLADITAIISNSPAYLETGGWLLIEHGHTQGHETRHLMLEQGFSEVQTVRDLSGNDRVTLGQMHDDRV